MSQLDLLNRRIEREILARKTAERILEEKALELHHNNVKLQDLNRELEEKVRQRTEELEKSRQAYKGLVENAGDVIYNLDKNGCFTYVNPAGEKILGIPAQTLLGKHFSEVLHPDNREEIVRLHHLTLRAKKEMINLEFPVTTLDGRTTWLGQKLNVHYDETGKLEHITGVARDITEIRNIQERIRKSEEKYRGLIENMELGLLEVDTNDKIARAYDGFCRMMGYDQEELIGKDPKSLFLDEADISFMEQQEADRKKGVHNVYEVQMKHKQGHKVWMLISGAPVMNDSGVVTGSMGIHYDISPQKKLEADLIRAKEEADDARQAEKEFLAQMSHEIRTPLNAVIGMTNLLSDTHLNPEQVTYVQDVKHAADVLHGLISDILDLSKIEAGQMELAPSLVNIHQTVVMMCRTMKVKAEENGNQLDYFIGDKVPQLMRLDRNILNQVLLNLIGNAIKFTHNGKIALHLDTQIEEDGSCLLQVKIVDTGIGIPENKLPDIFEKFKQAEGRNTHKRYGGTGLGLPICKKLVELHGGNIQVESETKKGSTFRFELKGQLADRDSSGQLSAADGTSGATVDFTKLKFLIVEDTFMNQRYIQSILKRWSSDSELANNGKEAVELSENERFDLILMDMQMPVMDGYEATRVIRADKTNPNHRVPIIALTASALLDDRRKALAAGMDEHLTKPFTPDQLKAAIQTQLSRPGASNPIERVPLPLAFRVTKVKQEHIDLYFGGDMDYAKEMVLEFLRSLPSERENIGRLIQSKDPAALSNWLHSMYPVVAMLGAPELSKEIKTKQLVVNESGWTDELVRWSEQLDTALSDLGDALEKWVEGQVA